MRHTIPMGWAGQLGWGSRLLLAVSLAGCAPADDAECGPGTRDVGGVCVLDQSSTIACGEGTRLDPETNQCLPFRSCGEGAVLAGDVCVPLAEGCGLGSILHTATLTCVPDVDCGPGTYLEEQQCLPESVCGPGSIFIADQGTCVAPADPCVGSAELNPITGLCESSMACGPGHVEVNGACYPKGRGLAGEADFRESLLDNNDPELGGTPEPMGDLDAAGAALVFVGTIGRPSDIDRDGDDDQDKDTWTFTGTAGSFVRVRILSNGLPQPYFQLRGPGGYRRSSALGFVVDAERYVFLPYDGTYLITVQPAIHALTGIAVGGTEADYVGVIEKVDRPVALGLTPSLDPVNNPMAITGSLTDWRNNLWLLNTEPGSAVVIHLPQVAPDVVPAVLAFDGSGRPVTDIVLDVSPARWAATFTEAANDVWLFIDWESAVGSRDDFTASLEYVPLQDGGAFAAGSSLVTDPLTLNSGAIAAFRYGLADATMVDAKVTASAPLITDLQLLGPAGTEVVTVGQQAVFYYGRPGTYVLFVRNASPQARNGVRVGGSLFPVVDLGELAEGSPAHLSGTSLTWRNAAPEVTWASLRTPLHKMMELQVRTDTGDPDLQVLSVDGSRVRKMTRGHLGAPFYVPTEQRDLQILRMVPVGGTTAEVIRPVVGWQLDVRLLELPPVIDNEPNDTHGTAVNLGPLPVLGMGYLEETATVFELRERDMYKFTLPEPLAPGESVAVRIDNLDADPDQAVRYGAIALRVYNKDFAFISSLPGQDTANPGINAANTVYHLGAMEGVGPFYLELVDSRLDDLARYMLGLEVVSVATEVEPNDVPNDATPIPEVGTVITGVHNWGATANGDLDYFRLQVDEVVADRSLTVKLENLEDSIALQVQLQREGGGFNAIGTAAIVTLRDPTPQVGSYLITVRKGPANATSYPTYRLSTSWGQPAEHEPNDTMATAQVLPPIGDEPVVVEGQAGTVRDVYHISLPEAPAPGWGVRVRALNLTDTNNVRLELFDNPDPLSPAPLVFDQGPGAELVSALAGTGPFAVVVTSTVSPSYRLVVEAVGGVEGEPNATLLQANLVSIPGQVDGVINVNDTDTYSAENLFAMDANEALEVRWSNLEHSRPISVEIVDRDGTTSLISSSGIVGAVVTPPGLPAGNYFVIVRQPGGRSDRSDLYRLTVNKVTVAP